MTEPAGVTMGPGGPKAMGVTISIDLELLGRYEDSFLATAWHVAQANPAEFGDRLAGELVERVGREIIRRWLANTTPELWHHQGHHHYWDELRQLARYEPGGPAGTREWSTGRWVPKATDDNDGPDAAQ